MGPVGVEDLVQHSLGPAPFEIELDVSAGQMHWARFGSDAIKRANLDGSNVETLYRPPTILWGIALPLAGGKMYRTEFSNGTFVPGFAIPRATLDGTGVEPLITSGLEQPT